jgi:hypothetical protein
MYPLQMKIVGLLLALNLFILALTVQRRGINARFFLYTPPHQFFIFPLAVNISSRRLPLPVRLLAPPVLLASSAAEAPRSYLPSALPLRFDPPNPRLLTGIGDLQLQGSICQLVGWPGRGEPGGAQGLTRS